MSGRLCKICDVRDYKTAEACAALGVDFIGLHCIDGIKPERQVEFQRIAKRVPLSLPGTEIVIVTRIVDSGVLLSVLREIPARFVQLHHSHWNRDEIFKLRRLLVLDARTRDVKIVGVAKPGEVKRAHDLAEVSSLVVVDRTYYGQSGKTPRIPPGDYSAAVEAVRRSGISCLVAGGLNPDNAATYLDASEADGVDVQTGVELREQRGVKDIDAISLLVTRIRST